jgi:hypothetical protein
MSELRGDLAVFQPIYVMQIVNLSGATGELRLLRRENSASVFFEKGNVTFAGIRDRPVKLGEYLVREGLIAQADLDEALRKRGSQRKRIGTLLVESGFIDEAGLKLAVVEQVKDVIYEIVRWEDGSFQFYRDRKPSGQEVRIDIPLDRLMLEGLKRLDEERENSK